MGFFSALQCPNTKNVKDAERKLKLHTFTALNGIFIPQFLEQRIAHKSLAINTDCSVT